MPAKFLLLSFGNAALYLSACLLIGTGFLLEIRMDKEDGAARLFGMTPDDWGEIHLVIAIGFVALTLLHLLLHLAWIKSAMRKNRWVIPVLVLGIGFIAALLLWPADYSGIPACDETRNCQEED